MKSYKGYYMRFLKAPLLMECKYSVIILISGMLLFGVKIGSDLEVYIYSLYSILIFRDLDEAKYKINLTLPIDSRFRLKMIYLNTYIICICSTLASSINCKLMGQSRSFKVSIIIMCLSILVSNIVYYKLCSLEFKESIMSRLTKVRWIGVVATLWGLIIIYVRLLELPKDIISYTILTLDNRAQLWIVIVLLIGAVITTIVSYKNVEYVVRGR